MKTFLTNLACFLLAILACVTLASPALAASTANDAAGDPHTSHTNSYKFSDMKACTDNTGYAAPNALGAGDPLLGVKVLELSVDGFSSTTVYNGKRVFLKTYPDTPVLNINVVADLANLGGSGAYICSDGSTAVSPFGYRGTIGRGLLAIEHENHLGEKQTFFTPNLFTVLEKNADVLPAFFGQEGSYRVAVYFETERYTHSVRDWVNPFKWVYVPQYEYRNYSVTWEFEIRNGSTMAYTFDANGNELGNGAVVADGFSLDMAESHYLDVQVKREVMAESSGFLKEATDIRVNTVGVDKRMYCDEGLYTITTTNPVTAASTVKKILVVRPQDDALKTAVATAHPTDFQELAASMTPAVSDTPLDNTADSIESDTDPSSPDVSNGPMMIIVLTFALSTLFLSLVTGAIVIIKKTR